MIVVDKPSGLSSFDVVRTLKRSLNTSRVGHTGTLDPMATGALVICAGWSTRLVPFLSDGWKRYTGTMRLGAATNTDDAEGEIIATSEVVPSDEAIAAGVAALTGEISQIPPQFSAIKVDGKRAYKQAREGEKVELAARPATVREFLVDRVSERELRFEISVSKGTYIRSLARDLGEGLGSYAHLTSLRRTENGGFDATHFVPVSEVDPSRLMSPWSALRSLEALHISDADALRIEQGQRVPTTAGFPVGTQLRVARESAPERLAAVCEIRSGEGCQILRSLRVRPPAG